jgi:hypothetical protein
MCVDVTVKVPGDVTSRVGADRLSRESGLHVVKNQGVLYFNLAPGGCGCTLIAGSPNPEEATLKLDVGAPERLEKALRILSQEGGRFSFATSWTGQESASSRRIQLRDLLRIVRENRIESGHEYVIGAAA